MKLVSSYDTAYEQHEREVAKDQERAALEDFRIRQDTAAQIALGICHLLEDQDADLEQAEDEARELLAKIRALQGES